MSLRESDDWATEQQFLDERELESGVRNMLTSPNSKNGDTSCRGKQALMTVLQLSGGPAHPELLHTQVPPLVPPWLTTVGWTTT